MALKDLLKINRKTFFDPRGWTGYDLVKSQTVYLYNTLKQVFKRPTQPTNVETFEEAMRRLHLTEQGLIELEKRYMLFSYVFFGLGILSLLFSIYLLLHHSTLAGFILGVGVTALLLTQAFRYNFWGFQIKHRKLGCTVEEWKRGKPYEEGEPKE